jgi:hypothetical protein
VVVVVVTTAAQVMVAVVVADWVGKTTYQSLRAQYTQWWWVWAAPKLVLVEIVILSAWTQWQVTAAATAIQATVQLAVQIWPKNPAMANLAAILGKAVVQAAMPTAVLLPVLEQAAIMALAVPEAATFQPLEVVPESTVVDTAVLMVGVLAEVLVHMVIMASQAMAGGLVPADNTKLTQLAMAAVAWAAQATAATTSHMAAL